MGSTRAPTREHKTTLTARIITADGVRARTVPVVLSYSPLEPWSLHLRFLLPKWVHWVISRDLVLAGLTSEQWVGCGDVLLSRPDDSHLLMGLHTPSGEATLTLPLPMVSRFVGHTLLDTPIGHEQFPIPDLVPAAEQ